MPAHRSESEAEVRQAVVDRLRRYRPDARILHEVNACSFGNRIDILAVAPAEIIAVEVKSERDKLDRLKAQLAAMERCSHHAIAALHERFVHETECSEFIGEYERDGVFYRPQLPADAPSNRTWIYPEKSRGKKYPIGDWREPEQAIQQPLPPTAIDILWRDELRVMCHGFGLPGPSRANMSELIATLRWNLSGRDFTRGICAMLRQRDCVEADPAIEWEMAS